MPTLEHATTLEPGRFTTSIRQTSEFLGALPNKENFSELPPETRHRRIQDAVAAGAWQKAHELQGENDLDANLYRLVGSLDSFQTSQRTINQLRKQYGTAHDIPQTEKRTFHNNKRRITEFNHILREVINTGASKFGFNDLMQFMTKMRAASGNRENIQDFYDQTREALIGMRNEAGVEQLLIAAGIEYELGSLKQDASGGDFIIEGTPVDAKSSQYLAGLAQEKARREGRNPNLIVWSHINFEDFEGGLTLPYESLGRIFAKLKPDLDKALHS